MDVLAGAKPFGDHYMIAPSGELYSSAYGAWRRLSPTKTKRGYYKTILTINGVKVHIRLHQAICEAFRGPRPSPKHMARHLDDNKDNNCETNIAWGTQSDNMRDAVRNGRKFRPVLYRWGHTPT